MEARLPRVTFGLRVFNGEPFVRYNLRALYPLAHQIIVVEGALSDAARMATPEGHSTDGTLDTLNRFIREDDPDNKLEVVIKDGFWSRAEDQMRAFARRATGDYLWMVDIDEFYRTDDMRAVLGMLRTDTDITAVFFKQITFWGGFDYVADGWYLRQRQGEGPGVVLRLVKWGDGYRYASHRPVTILDPDGKDLSYGKALDGENLAKEGRFMYHYSLVFPRQVREKAEHYFRAGWADAPRIKTWAEKAYFQLRWPYHVHNVYRYPSWLTRFQGRHPREIESLRADLNSGRVSEETRNTEDIEALLDSPWYRSGRAVLKGLDPLAQFAIRRRRRVRRLLESSIGANSRELDPV